MRTRAQWAADRAVKMKGPCRLARYNQHTNYNTDNYTADTTNTQRTYSVYFLCSLDKHANATLSAPLARLARPPSLQPHSIPVRTDLHKAQPQATSVTHHHNTCVCACPTAAASALHTRTEFFACPRFEQPSLGRLQLLFQTLSFFRPLCTTRKRSVSSLQPPASTTSMPNDDRQLPILHYFLAPSSINRALRAPSYTTRGIPLACDIKNTMKSAALL
jgi:hypothetical protein